MSGVVIQMGVPDVPRASVAALVSACTSAVRVPGGCTSSRNDPAGSPAAVVLVMLDAKSALAHLEVTVLTPAPTFRAYDLTFSAVDTELERFRTIGLAIATLVGDTLAQTSSSAAQGGAPGLAGTAPSRGAPEQEPNLRGAGKAGARDDSLRAASPWIVDVQARLARGAAGATPAWGGFIGVGYRVGAPWTLAARLGYTVQSPKMFDGSISVARAEAGFGISTPLSGTTWALEMHLHLLVERLDVRATSFAGTSAAQHRWNGGATAALACVWRLSGRFGLVGGFGLDALGNATDVTAFGENVSHIPLLDGFVSVGGRAELP